MPTRRPTTKIAFDPHARLGNEIRFKVLREHVGDTPAQKLVEVLKAAASELESMQDFSDVVYIVLNHPPIRLRDGKRYFIAALNSIDTQTKDFLRENGTSSPEQTQSEHCEVVFLTKALELSEFAPACRQLWVSKWNEYWRITEAGLRNDRHTWNQLLFKPGVQPEPIGVCWGREPLRTPYFFLSPELAANIGLGCLSQKDAVKSLLGLGLDEFDKAIAKGGDLREFGPLWDIFNGIDPHGARSRTQERVAWKVFHLIRSYGLWGGGAFLSIPLVIGAGQRTHTAVLSICTKKPLSPQRYRDWVQVSGILLGPVLEEEMFRVARQLDFAVAAYSIGHPLKNRLMPIERTIGDLKRQLPNVKDGNLQKELEVCIARAEVCVEVLRKFGHVLDVTSRCISEGVREAAFLQKKDWHETQPYDLTSRLREIALRALPPSCHQNVQIAVDKSAAEVVIGLWIEDPTTGDPCRPGDIFYDEILQELVINAAFHSNIRRDMPMTITLSCTSLKLDGDMEAVPVVVLANRCSDTAGTTQFELPLDKWFVYDSNQKGTEGGLPVITTFMQASNLGRGVFVHRSRVSGEFIYRTALPLRGLLTP